jgi:ADP-ribosylglycohydrolase
MITTRDRYRGCLLGGAVGDALGAGIEFMSLDEIGRRYGPAGVTGYVPCYRRSSAITDDTQMTLFTAEGLLRARRGGGDVPGAVWQAYQRWLLTQAAALTHGHPSGYLAAAAFAQMISHLASGGTRPDAVGEALAAVPGASGSGEVSVALAAAVAAAAAGPPSTETMCSLGAGWVAEEALAVAVYCALTAADFRSGVLLAVNHGGDSDSTGAICGNLLGASLGVRAIDADLLDDLEGRDVIRQVADDLYDVFAEGAEPSAERYPG